MVQIIFTQIKLHVHSSVSESYAWLLKHWVLQNNANSLGPSASIPIPADIFRWGAKDQVALA